MNADTAWNEEPDLDEETAARLDRFLQEGKTETRQILEESVDVDRKLGESLARLAADDAEAESWPPSLLKGRHIA